MSGHTRIVTVATRITVALACLLVAHSANAGVITINNAGFEDASGNGGNGNLTTPADWTEEDPNNVFVDNNGTTWTPESDRTLYFNGGTAAVNQDLSHNWASDETFTLGIIGHNPRWASGTNVFKVQLRQADGTVLWDSGDLDVAGTVTTTAPATYTGTGHIFSWTFDASTFSGAGVVAGSQLNIRIAHVSAPTYIDDVSLSFEGPVVPTPAALPAGLALLGLAAMRRRRMK